MNDTRGPARPYLGPTRRDAARGPSVSPTVTLNALGASTVFLSRRAVKTIFGLAPLPAAWENVGGLTARTAKPTELPPRYTNRRAA